MRKMSSQINTLRAFLLFPTYDYCNSMGIRVTATFLISNSRTLHDESFLLDHFWMYALDGLVLELRRRRRVQVGSVVFVLTTKSLGNVVWTNVLKLEIFPRDTVGLSTKYLTHCSLF